MHYGATIFPTADAIRPDELGRELESRGFESLWVAEHSHIPASRRTPYPGPGDLPDMYYETMDPFVALTAAAMSTTTLKLGTGIALVTQRDPIHLAKQVSSLDVVSDGRFLFGIGAGWNREEMEDHGTDPERRFGRMRETVEAMKEIWANDPAEYHGDHIGFDPMFQRPKPIQKPHPPIHVGGIYPGGLRRAVAYADGWMPIGARADTDPRPHLEAVDRACVEAGRVRSDFEVSIYAAPMTRDPLRELAELGVDRVVFALPPHARDELLPVLDHCSALMDGDS
ncbi:MAG: LLM class F420-dependent oxidoreductase [Acidimicrobiia bacterium]|nr:LLM class F420-dependent oxidoreductase [Acidimicrobiia bacterium]